MEQNIVNQPFLTLEKIWQKCIPVSISWIIDEFSHIDGRPRFDKHSIDDGKQVKIAAIDPDFE